MHENYWGMGYGFWVIATILIVVIVVFIRNRRRKF